MALFETPQADDGRYRAHSLVLSRGGVQVHLRARGGEAGAREARRARADPGQGEHRGADGEDQHPAAGVHQRDEARGVRADGGHGVRDAERRAHLAVHLRDCAQAGVGGARGQGSGAVQDGGAAHVGLADAAAPVQGHPRGHLGQGGTQGPGVGEVLRLDQPGDRRADSFPQDGQGDSQVRASVPARRAERARAAHHAVDAQG